MTHTGGEWWRVAEQKPDRAKAVTSDHLDAYKFITPRRSKGDFLVVDIDRPEAVLEIFSLIPPEIRPSWVVETKHGAQAGWFIETVAMGANARLHPVRYARAVGLALRAALDGDQAVDPLTAARIRNPVYAGADLLFAPNPPIYKLGDLHKALENAGLWTTQKFSRGEFFRAAAVDPGGTIPQGERNVTVFNACRFAAYAGHDFTAAAHEAAARCSPPLPASEVAGIIRSVDRYIRRTDRQPGEGTSDAVRAICAEAGRRGGSRNTPAQKAARARGPEASRSVRSAESIARRAAVVELSKSGLSRSQIAAQLNVSYSTVRRALLDAQEDAPEMFIYGASGGRGGSPSGAVPAPGHLPSPVPSPDSTTLPPSTDQASPYPTPGGQHAHQQQFERHRSPDRPVQPAQQAGPNLANPGRQPPHPSGGREAAAGAEVGDG